MQSRCSWKEAFVSRQRLSGSEHAYEVLKEKVSGIKECEWVRPGKAVGCVQYLSQNGIIFEQKHFFTARKLPPQAWPPKAGVDSKSSKSVQVRLKVRITNLMIALSSFSTGVASRLDTLL